MKKQFAFIGLFVIVNTVVAQNKISNTVQLKELEVPNSPAFIITEITPSLIQTPSTPKEFVLGVAQSFQQSETGFPENYSLEFVPYWWFRPTGRSIYSLVGLNRNAAGSIENENPFSSLKFTSLSMAFLKKDLIPDTSKTLQKMFSLGLRSTIIKIHTRSYSESLKNKIAEWHSAAQSELEIIQEAIARADPKKKMELLKQAANYKPSTTDNLVKEINKTFLQKPIFSWDVAAAFVTYGIGDTSWHKGRSGVWTNLASYLPLALGEDKDVHSNYINLNFSLRFLSDNYFKNDKGLIAKANVIDVGGKIAFEFNALSIGYEYLKRNGKGVPGDHKRSVGIINYKLSDNLYINGAFGKNFSAPDKLVALFGIKWGLGSESVSLPD
jgi:hypothetical protein